MPRAIAYALLLLVLGCAARPALGRDETTLVAWWVEDVCRGLPRTVAELRTENASQGLQRIAEWAATHGTVGSLPSQLGARRARWPVVRSFLADGTLVPAEDALVAVPATVSGDTAVLARITAKEENRDRLTGEVVVLSMAREDERGTRLLRAALREARLAADRAVAP